MTNYKHLIYLLSFSFLLSACGLETDDEEAEESEVREETIRVHDQHPLLPLTSGTAIVYDDSNDGEITASISYDEDESQGSEFNVYKINFPYNNANIGLIVSSSSNGVTWLGIDGPFPFNYNETIITLNSLRFQSPITIIGNTADGSTSADVLTSSSTVNAAEFAVDYTITTANSTFDPGNTLYGTLPAHDVVIVATIEASLGGSVLGVFEISTNLSFVEGIGVVDHSGNYIGVQPDSTINSLVNLPNTVWYQNNNGNPILANSSSNIFQTNTGNILAESYSLYNAEELDNLDWIDVSIDSATGAYKVEVSYTENLPTELTSVQVLFEDRQYPRYLSGNVTVLVD